MSDNYWIPEDVKHQWSNLMTVLSGYTNCQIELSLIVCNGSIDYICPPEKKNLQPRKRDDIKSSHNLWSPIRQLQSIGNNVRGTALLSITIIFDSNNNPLLWSEPVIKKLNAHKY